MSDDVCRLSDLRLGPGTRHDIAPDTGGRFVQVQSGGVWIGSARRAYCVTLGGGIWLPASIAHRMYVPYGAALRELRIAPAVSDGPVHSARIARCSEMLTSLLSESASQALARAPAAVASLLFGELEAAVREGAWEIALDMPSSSSRIAALCDAMILDPGRDTRLDALAARACVSVRTLHRLFVDELGVGAGRWRRTVLTGTAMGALALGMPVSAVARELGFTPSAFSTFFKSHVGWAPNHWLANQGVRAGPRPA
ncbi:helix-turn-helix domain-containing protein [Paraburkholderia silviterrae]|uniref:AraC family transcriptional regulator n=1 Tax=Paraburkholderia silviterrae TaxID=2528715 RepID=A0A4R5M918_9BURK|nr:AraC family transcriptional regulator [Paraburkholderia silviterrae]TDG23102.1 AraC family transcriptional regulator [Paraburkholderia silviterrae]